jgi:hypothetical protein
MFDNYNAKKNPTSNPYGKFDKVEVSILTPNLFPHSTKISKMSNFEHLNINNMDHIQGTI